MNGVFIVRHVPHEGPGLVADALERAGVPFEFVDVFDRPLPRIDREQPAGLVVMGGPMGVHSTDRYPALTHEVEWIRQAVDRQLPLLGICLGSQLLAKALDADVYRAPRKEIGWAPVYATEQTPSDPLLSAVPPTLQVLHWHGDTFDLPAGAAHLASSDVCPHQAFRAGPCAWGLQFHLEVTAAIIEQWLAEAGMRGELEALAGVDAATIRRDTQQHLAAMHAVAAEVFGRFADLCRQRSQ